MLEMLLLSVVDDVGAVVGAGTGTIGYIMPFMKKLKA
jgi:N-acetylglucosamine kinase-like BadF-type ATPase